MMMLEYTQCAIEELLPHSPPMVLINRLITYDDEGLTAEVDITADSMFFNEEVGGVPVWVSLEYMAQSISALAGIRAKQNKTDIKLGFLLGTRRFVMHEKILDLGQSYQIIVEQLFRDDSGLASFKCTICLNHKMVAEAKVNVFEVSELEQELN